MGLLDGILDSGNHDSILGNFGKQFQKYTDPIAMIPGFGDKWVNLTSVEIPRLSNTALSKVVSPFDKVDETINPVRQIPFVDKIGDVVRDKPASAIGTVVGGIFAAPAIGGALGAGGAGGAAAGGGAAGGSGAGVAGLTGSGLGVTGYGGGISSSVLPGIFEGASVAPSFGGAGGLGAFGGGSAATGSLTGAGASGGLALNGGSPMWGDLLSQAAKMQGQNRQQSGDESIGARRASGGAGGVGVYRPEAQTIAQLVKRYRGR